jgi:hypothetical protein
MISLYPLQYVWEKTEIRVEVRVGIFLSSFDWISKKVNGIMEVK